jgi:ketosteroid isomerase-like protein
MPSRADTLAVVRQMLEAAQRRDVAALTSCYADDAVAVSPLFGTIEGAAAIGAYWAQLFSSFTGLSVDVSNTLVDGNRVAMFATVTTSDRVGIFGLPAASGALTYRLILLFTIAGGKIVHDERIYDSTGVLERLEKLRLDKELQTAAEVQRTLLSRTAHIGRFCESVGDSMPCRAIGGDFFEFIELPSGDVGIAMGDVAGKGPAAALLAAMLQGMLVSEAGAERGPGATLSRMNRQLAARAVAGRFATLVYAVLSPGGRLVYANGGHNAPAVVGGDDIRRLGATGPILGMFPDATFDEETLQLGDRETLVMFTDGVTEARNTSDEEFDEDRLLACLASEAASPPAAMLAQILASVRSFSQQTEQADDITVTVTRRLGAAS